MGAVIACIDSDVLIDYFDGIDAAGQELSRYDGVIFSRITWMEVLVSTPAEELRKVREDFLRQFSIVELDERVAREAMALRRQHRLKLPNAIIWASARLHDALLVTRNAKDFPIDDPGIRAPYRL
jgi:predicted nucleic acid-binding protein